MAMIGVLLIQVLQIYNFILLARVLMSWFPIDRSNRTVDQIVGFLYDITEPVLAPVRDLMPRGVMIDFSPIIVFIGINILQGLVRAAFF